MKVFIDTEFTDLYEDFGPNKLISIGLVAESGEELYIELANYYKEDECSEFVIEHVLPYLNHGKSALSTSRAALALKGWCEGFDERIQIVSDAPQFDFKLLCEFLFEQSVIIDNLDVQALQVSHPLLEQLIADYFRTVPDAIRHHALWDARALAYVVMNKA